MADLLINLQEFTSSLPPFLRWIGVMLAAVIPYVEAEGGAILGIAAGVSPFLAIPAAIAGNGIALAVVVNATSAVRSGVTARRNSTSAGGVAVTEEDNEPAPDAKRARMRRVFDRYGVPGVSLLGPLLLPSHVTSAAMVGFGAPKRTVLIWGIVAVGAWAILFGTIAYLGVSALVG
ncbi:hypothetical protein [Pseudactinotalea sp.]|uniref:hypothetical protein n=1 Tax=Pseudactinotalea sp. TaxID=1926260 RepID=UPI003B3BC646